MDRNRRGTEMSEEIPGVALTEPPSDRQRLFVRYLMAILIDLTVLNLVDEYWDLVTIGSFELRWDSINTENLVLCVFYFILFFLERNKLQ